MELPSVSYAENTELKLNSAQNFYPEVDCDGEFFICSGPFQSIAAGAILHLRQIVTWDSSGNKRYFCQTQINSDRFYCWLNADQVQLVSSC
jgi:hypothetical protein